MRKTKIHIRHIALCSGVVPAVRLSFASSATSDIGLLHSFSHPNFIEVIRNGGIQQSNLFSVSAGNDSRMSTMRPNPYLSAGIEMRRDKLRGLLQLNTRTN
jgi:hypothetical protein